MKRLIFIMLFVLVFSMLPAYSQKDKTSGKHSKEDNLTKSFSLFDNDELLNVSISFDLKRYLKKDFRESIDGVLTFMVSESDSIVRNVRINNRGTYRSSFCKYPPLMINFSKPVQAYAGQEKISKLKMVTRCEPGNLYDEYVLREFLVYKLYNVFTDTSYRVRLIKVNFIDINNKKNPLVQYGFFIEPKEVVARRTSLTVIKNPRLSQRNIFPAIMDRVAIFNYMISNYDWSVAGEHNITVMQTAQVNPSGLGIAIPHDFDGTGVVDAEYAVPKSETNLKSIRDRIFLGSCRTEEIFRKELKQFLAKKEALYSVINEFNYLDQRAKKDITNFLNEFFNQIEKQKTLDTLIGEFMKACKK